MTQNGYQVLGKAGSAEEAISMARTVCPDLIMMDIELPGKMDGIDAAIRIRSKTGIPSVFLTGYDEAELVHRAVKADPLGYIMKPLNQTQILAAVDFALAKKEREKTRRLSHEIPNLPKAFIGFTAQELRVAEMIREGMEQNEIAHELGICTSTVNWHRKKIRRKLGIENTKIDLMVALRTLTMD